MTDAQFKLMMSSGAYLWEHMGTAPVILIPCQEQPRLPRVTDLPEELRSGLDDERRDEFRLVGICSRSTGSLRRQYLARRTGDPHDIERFWELLKAARA